MIFLEASAITGMNITNVISFFYWDILIVSKSKIKLNQRKYNKYVENWVL